MTSAQLVETSVANNSPSQDSNHPDDLFQSRYVTPGFKTFSYLIIMLATTKTIRRKMALLIVIIISQLSSVSSWSQLFCYLGRLESLKWHNKSNETGVLVRGENRIPRRKTSWSKVEKHPTSIHMTSSPESNLGHIGCYGTRNVSPPLTITTQLHKEQVSWEGPVHENVLYP